MRVQQAAAAPGAASSAGSIVSPADSAASLAHGSVPGPGRIPTYLKSNVSGGASSTGNAAVYGTAAAAAGALDVHHSGSPSSHHGSMPSSPSGAQLSVRHDHDQLLLQQQLSLQQQQQQVLSPRSSLDMSPRGPAPTAGAAAGAAARPMLLGVPRTVIDSVETSSVQQGWSEQLASTAAGSIPTQSSASPGALAAAVPPAAAAGKQGCAAGAADPAAAAGDARPSNSGPSHSASSSLLGSILSLVHVRPRAAGSSAAGGGNGGPASLASGSNSHSQVCSLKQANSHLQRHRHGSSSVMSTASSSSMGAGSGLLSRANSSFYQLNRQASLRWGSALNMLGRRPAAAAGSGNGAAAAGLPGGAAGTGSGLGGGGDEMELGDKDLQASSEECSALLLMAVTHLACLAQVVLDATQIAMVVLTQDLMWRLPDWAAAGLTGLVITQASSWQWVPFDCLLPGWSPASGAVVQALIVMLLPFIYVAVLLPLLLLARNAASRHAASSLDQQQQQQSDPLNRSSWVLLTALSVAAMSYCYRFYSATVLSAFNCMQLAARPAVPGEMSLPASFWVPDMQLQCWRGAHVAVAVVAVIVGIPLLLGYWLLLLVLAWPAADGAAAAQGGGDDQQHHAQQQHARSPRLLLRQLLAALLALPAQLLGPPVRLCQRYTQPIGVSGSACAGLDVWNVEWRWWWLLGREGIKFVVIAMATLMSMWGPRVQAMLVLLLVVVAAALSWQVQAGCSTTMARLLFVGQLWLQALALMVLLPTTQWLDPAAFGGVLMGLLLLLALQVAVMLLGRTVRCVKAAGMTRKLRRDVAPAAPS